MWWFQIFFIFTPTWGNDPIWLKFFRWVETTQLAINYNSTRTVSLHCFSQILLKIVPTGVFFLQRLPPTYSNNFSFYGLDFLDPPANGTFPPSISMVEYMDKKLGGGFKHLLFSTLLGEIIQFDYIVIFKWVGSTTNQMEISYHYLEDHPMICSKWLITMLIVSPPTRATFPFQMAELHGL